jgi:hypothetical protein
MLIKGREFGLVLQGLERASLAVGRKYIQLQIAGADVENTTLGRKHDIAKLSFLG